MAEWSPVISIPGPPATKGSVCAIPTESGKGIVLPDNRRLRTWTQELRHQMFIARPPVLQKRPVELYVVVQLRRPASHYRTGRYERVLKVDAPAFAVVKPDGDKILRAVKDAGTGYWWTDDACVVRATVEKRWASRFPENEADTEQTLIAAVYVDGGEDG